MIEDIGGIGILLSGQTSARIVNNTIRDVARTGIAVSENSSARIGFLSFFDPEPSPNTIIASSEGWPGGNFGIWINRASSARIASNTVMNFRFGGIFLNSGSQADIADNTIEDNGDGIRVIENSGVNLGNNTGQNNWIGVSCSVGGYVSGGIGTLDGNIETTIIEDSCIDDLSP